MQPLSLSEILSATGGQLLNAALPHHRLAAICTDTRCMQPHSLFVAIRGETHDGHAHLQAAFASGAITAMVDRVPDAGPATMSLIVVPDTRVAMGKLAAHVRRSLRGSVIAVGGSNGKTGTKALIHAALNPPLRGSASPKSFNNDIGVPLTIFAADPADDYLVLELGTNHPGEIENLSRISEPDVAVITNVGAEHLEFFGDLDGVRREEAQLVAGLRPNGLLVVNGDDAGLLAAIGGWQGRRIIFGWGDHNDLRPTQVHCTLGGVGFRISDSGAEFFIPQLGRHTAVNALAAIAVGRRLGLSDSELAANLAKAQPPEMRLAVRKIGPITLINDAYNANPSSMQAALQTLADLETPGRRVAVLGDMRELGESAAQHHVEIGRFAAECGVDVLHCVGEHAERIAEGAAAGGLAADRIHRHPTAAAATTLAGMLEFDDLVLLKASRGVRLETIIPAIEARHAPPRPQLSTFLNPAPAPVR